MGNARGILLGKWDVRCLHTYTYMVKKVAAAKGYYLQKRVCGPSRAETPQPNTKPCNIVIDSVAFKKVP